MRAGDLLSLTRAASPQFVTPIRVRLIRVLADRHTYEGWTWLECYQLDERGNAVDRRELYVFKEGIEFVPPPRPPAVRKPLAQRRAKA